MAQVEPLACAPGHPSLFSSFPFRASFLTFKEVCWNPGPEDRPPDSQRVLGIVGTDPSDYILCWYFCPKANSEHTCQA